MNSNEAAVVRAIEALHALRDLASGDVEVAHARADKILVNLLNDLGIRKVAKLYDSIEKWYA